MYIYEVLYVLPTLQIVVCCLVTSVVSSPVPVYELARPFWDNACNVVLTSAPLDDPEDSGEVSWHEQLVQSLERVRLELKNAWQLLEYEQFDKLYIAVKRGVSDHQYIPNWVPSKGDVQALLATETLTATGLTRYLPSLLKDLQKFAVAFEQVYKDEVNSYDNSRRGPALEHLIRTLKMLLCEVEAALMQLDLSFGPSVSRDIMTSSERDIADFTHRMIRDNGVLVKYRDFLSGWNRLIKVKTVVQELRKYRKERKIRRKNKRISKKSKL